MPTVAITESTFEKTVAENEIVLVDFWAGWCAPCLRFGPIFEQSSEEHTDIVHAKVDTDAEPGLQAAFDISSIPTLMAFRDGILVFNQAGALPKQSLEQVVQAVKALDMDEVRAQVALQEQHHSEHGDHDHAGHDHAGHQHG
jgi:thioredoxin 1